MEIRSKMNWMRRFFIKLYWHSILNLDMKKIKLKMEWIDMWALFLIPRTVRKLEQFNCLQTLFTSIEWYIYRQMWCFKQQFCCEGYFWTIFTLNTLTGVYWGELLPPIFLCTDKNHVNSIKQKRWEPSLSTRGWILILLKL